VKLFNYLKQFYSRKTLVIADIIMLNLSLIISYFLRFETFNAGYFQLNFIPVITVLGVITFLFAGLYDSIWKYASISELQAIIKSAAIINILFMAYAFVSQTFLPRSIPIINFMMIVILLGGLRFSLRLIKNHLYKKMSAKSPESRVLIIGAGDAAEMIIREMNKHPDLGKEVVGLIDDDPAKQGLVIHSAEVLGNRNDIPEVISKHNVNEVIIAIPSAPGTEIKEIYKLSSQKKGVTVKTVPGMYEILQGDISLGQLREVKVEDLLRRDPVELKTDTIDSYIKGKKIVVTGGGGSIGSELCRQIARFDPELLIIFDIYENNAYLLKRELTEDYPELDIRVEIGDVRDEDKVNMLFAKCRPEVVFHAAAHKHVPLMESNPGQAVKNNIFGTKNVARMADRYGVEKFILISTDKAVNPTNVMGATKRLAEMVIQDYDKGSLTDFAAVRFGNVLGSSASVVPIFKEQIANGGPVTVTHEDVTRYFMTIPEAVQLVMQAGAISNGGEVFVLDMGEPVKIMDLARDLISLSGFEPGIDIEIEVTGLRPGEKLYEELMSDSENNQSTEHQRIFISNLAKRPDYNLMKELDKFDELLDTEDNRKLINKLKDLVVTYKPNRSNVREVIFSEEFKQDVSS